jgi:hypothetical protein
MAECDNEIGRHFIARVSHNEAARDTDFGCLLHVRLSSLENTPHSIAQRTTPSFPMLCWHASYRVSHRLFLSDPSATTWLS